ncbi:hypothetical protein VNO78_22705 [Psophocarpus tetragonolobus]|uniref:AIG1-type G domain-containing protein n=1 Tax=Psophocarpus tetragonolobus TaxID=3891 RepID=A0AAN9S2U6_PSOTE
MAWLMASSDSKELLTSSVPPQIRAPLTMEVDDSVSSNGDYTSQEEDDDACVQQLSPMHAAPLRVTPFAHLSTFNDHDDEDEEGEWEMLSVARVGIKMHDTSFFMNSLPVSQSLFTNDFASFSGSDEDLDVNEHALDQDLRIRVVSHQCSSATDSDVMSEYSQDSFNDGFGMARVIVNELENVEAEADADTTMQGKLVQGTSIVVCDTTLFESNVEDYNNSRMQEQDMSVRNLQKPQVHCIPAEAVSEAFAENVEYCAATQTTEADGSVGDAADQASDSVNLVSITRSVTNAQLYEWYDSSAGFESNYDAYENNKIHSVIDPTLLQECYLEKDLSKSKTILGVSLEDDLFCDYHSAENVETLNLEYTAKEEATVELNTVNQESEREDCASNGDVDGLMSVVLDQFREQISALSILMGSRGSETDSKEKLASHGTMNLPKYDAKSQIVCADVGAESDGCSGIVTSADESNVIFLKDTASFSSLPYYDIQVCFQHSTTEKEKEKIQKIQAISVKFLRLAQRLNLSLEDSLVSKVLYRVVADIERRLNQEYVIKSSKIAAERLEENCQDDLDFSLTILLLGRSGVGKSATINSIFGDMKVVTNAFEPATISIKEVSGTIDGIKIRILDTPGLKSSVKEQAYNRKILSSIKRYRKFPPDVILYVDRIDAQARDFNDLPMLRSITSSLGSSIWQHAILTLTHATSVPFDGPSGSPLSYEVFVAKKSYLVQQSITQAVRNLCQLSSSFICPVALVENHPLCGKDMFGDSVLPNGPRWRSQLLALCCSLKILSEVSSLSGPQTLFDHLKHSFFQDHSRPLCHLFSSLLKSPAHLKFSANWN